MPLKKTVKKKRVRANRRSVFKQAPAKTRRSGLFWLITGLLLGTGVTAALYFNHHVPTTLVKKLRSQMGHGLAATSSDSSEPKFEFYHLLSKEPVQISPPVSDSSHLKKI